MPAAELGRSLPMKMKAPKPRNPVARSLSDGSFRQRTVKSKKSYSRKRKDPRDGRGEQA